MIKTRFAPSPTGMLHIGGLRTALFAFLVAKKLGGTFALRIEDTDQERFVEGGIENIIRALNWAGLTIDEGADLNEHGQVIQKGEHGPYIQSERLEIYAKYTKELLDLGAAYYCFCSKERLEQVRALQEASKTPTGYDGTCRHLSADVVKAQLEAGVPYVIRMKMPKEGVTRFTDLVRGEVEFQNKLLDDHVLIKTDAFPTYHFAVVVDDHEMQCTHVIRGEEWLPSTPKHLLLYKAFGWEAPQFAHLPLLINENKQKLSKRHGDVSVEDFKAKGYLKEALVNFIALLGWNPGTEQEIFSLKELEKTFTIEQVSKAAAVFNREKLNWFNKQYLMSMDLDELTQQAIPFFKNSGLITSDTLDEMFIKKAVAMERARSATLSELPTAVGFLFAEELVYDPELLVWKKSTKGDAREKLHLVAAELEKISPELWTREQLEVTMLEWIKTNGFGNGDVLWPLRVALSGQKNSPGPFEIADALGKKETLKRVAQAIKMCE